MTALIRAAARTIELSWVDGRVMAEDDRDFEIDWSVSSRSATGRRDVRLVVRHTSRSPQVASVRLAVHFESPEVPRWLVPGVFYGENRPAGNDRPFPRFAVDGDPKVLESDRWEFRADRAATHAVFAWTPAGGVAVTANECTALGVTGVGFGWRHGHGEVSLRFPFAEYPVTYYGSAEPRPAVAATYEWQPGEAIEIGLAIYDLPADHHAYAAVLREEHARLAGGAPLNPWVDVRTAADLAAEGLARWHYAEPGVLLETVGFDREITGTNGEPVDRQAMHVGWLSGIPWAYALLAHARRVDDDEQAAKARKVIDFCCSELSPSGTFWGVWYRTKGWYQSWSPVVHALHSRTLGEATLFLLRALRLAPGQETWKAAACSNLDAVIARQRADGNVGATHHAITGAVLSWAGSAGLAWVNALAESDALDWDGRYLAAAERAGGYYARFVEDEFLHGAPEDVDLAPTSEDGYVALMAYLALHRRTGAAKWLDLAQRTADWLLTFRYTYNVAFPPGTPLDVYRFATRGADTASPSNQHLHAYGLICTAEMHELSAATGDAHYGRRADETLACFRQFIARFDGDFNAYRGMASDRYYQTDCFQSKGMLLNLSHAWSIGVLLLACEQTLAHAAR
jgi:hypothetical protein